MDSNQHDQLDQLDQAQWFVAHTYSGYENKVKASIEATVENRNMEDLILEVQVPVQEVVESKNGKRVVKEKKLFPGYVMIKMFMTDDSWYVVRNTRGVTGFVGPASKPVPLSKAELKSMGIRQQRVEISMKVGEEVKVTEGPLEGFTGIIEEVHPEKSKVKVNVSMFGRETLAELGFEQIEKINT
ncbi:transcription termination/antitermination protein NusG [Acetobacterium tundrae]|uniref:Transcription termination/antitermination protein NusG n=1 Tax=Acetobacterium tundrae TaxID=132932 RepID=A0ABR6WH03_9FIRM|nr:transcription termination/antitermination protein NusG [Acetobacterium tundrae]MBC3795737.1 transcription termination/antitermination protein NusG [Acetobacterium tundrae]